MNKLRQFGAGEVSQQQQEGPPDILKTSESFDHRQNSEGKHCRRVESDWSYAVLQDRSPARRKMLNQILGSFHQEAQRLQAQEQQAQSQPWMQLATALSANMAQARDMPGWVQALGRTAAQMNPSVQELQARRMQLMGQEAGIAEKAAGLDLAAMKASTDTKQAEFERKKLSDQNRLASDYLNRTRIVVREGGGPMDWEKFQSGGIGVGIEPQRLPGLYQAHVEEAKQLAAGQEKKVERSKDLQQNASGLALERGEKLEKLRAGDRLSVFRQAFSLTHGQPALEFEKAKKQIDAEVSFDLAKAKSEGIIGSGDMGQLKAGLGTNIYLSSMGTMLKIPELGKVAEPFFSVERDRQGHLVDIRVNPEAVMPKAWQSLSKAEADNMIAHEMPRILALLFKQGVGAQMFRSAKGVELLNSLGITNKIRVDQMEAILQNIRHTNNLSNFAPVVMTKSVDWKDPNRAAMAAMDDPENAAFWAGKDQWGGKIPIRIPTPAGFGAKQTATAAPAITTPPPGLEEKLKTLPKGKGLRDARGNIWTLQDGKAVMVQ